MEENEITCLWACLKCGKVFYDTENEFASRGRRCKECAEQEEKESDE